jgi:integral membrane protein
MKKYFRVLGFAEALSFLVLLGIAMPLKYVWGIPEATRIIGMIHGVLFIAYAYMAFVVGRQMNWPMTRVIGAWIAASLPFGPIFYDRKLLASDPA